MFNVIGRKPAAKKLLRIPGAHWHDYGKTPRPGRKLGHVTLITARRGARDRAARRLRRLLNP
jgi:5-(carboxyamino)imidazole ribonucleotide synthase